MPLQYTCNNCTRGITMMPSPRLLLQCVYAYVRASYAAVIWAEWAVLSSSSSSTERRWCCNMKIVLVVGRTSNQTSTTGYFVYVYVYCSSTRETCYLKCIWVNHDTIEVLRSNFVYVPYWTWLIHIDIKYGFSFFNLKSKTNREENESVRPSSEVSANHTKTIENTITKTITMTPTAPPPTQQPRMQVTRLSTS